MEHLARIALVALALVFPSLASADAPPYPGKPIRMIVPFAPGGASDFVARLVAPKMGEILGQQVVIENKAGASGNIGMEAAAKAAPDGYTIYLGNIGTIAINPTVFHNSLTVHPDRDFIPVTLCAEVPSVLIVHPDLPVKSVADLVALARSKPGALNFGSPGSSTLNRLEMERFMKATGTSIVHIPYKGGAGPAVTGMLSGDTQVMFITLSSAMTFIQAGRLRAIGIATAKRMDALPDVPTMAEAGYPDLVSSSWQGMFVPAGTPRPIVDKLYHTLQAVLDTPEMRQRFKLGGVDVVVSKSPEEFASFVTAEMARWGAVARESGATID